MVRFSIFRLILTPVLFSFGCCRVFNSFPKRQVLDSSKLTFDFDENGRKFSAWVENTVGKGEIASYEQFLLFQQRF